MSNPSHAGRPQFRHTPRRTYSLLVGGPRYITMQFGDPQPMEFAPSLVVLGPLYGTPRIERESGQPQARLVVPMDRPPGASVWSSPMTPHQLLEFAALCVDAANLISPDCIDGWNEVAA